MVSPSDRESAIKLNQVAIEIRFFDAGSSLKQSPVGPTAVGLKDSMREASMKEALRVCILGVCVAHESATEQVRASDRRAHQVAARS